MVTQYPYELYKLVTAPATQNLKGDYVAESADWELVGACRDEADKAGLAIKLEDGTIYRSESVIYLPKPRNRSYPGIFKSLLQGTQIEVRDEDGNVRVEAKVRRVIEGYLNVRLWV